VNRSAPPPTSPDVATWLSQARAGSDSALGRLMDFCRDYLLLVANRELNAAPLALTSPSDLAEQTHREALHDFATFRGATKAELLDWLRRMLLGNLYNLQRQQASTEKGQFGREALEAGAAPGQPIGHLSSPSSHLRHQERAKAVERAVNRLPEDQRQVILWHHQEGLSFEEIGLRLDQSPEAARKLWARAIRELSEHFRPPGEPEA
jgi:RNA polymerase sigma-70 factor (ECF subfamily)